MNNLDHLEDECRSYAQRGAPCTIMRHH